MSIPNEAALAAPPKRPLLAAVLQLTCLFGGLGYFYLGLPKKGARLFAAVLAAELINAVAAANQWPSLAMVIGPMIFCAQLLSAVDAWLLARGEPGLKLLGGS